MKKWSEMTKVQKIVSAFIVFSVVSIIVSIVSPSSETKPNTVTTSPTPTISNTQPTPTISVMGYSLLNEAERQSDVKGKLIKERYILLKNNTPSVEELTTLVTTLGKDNQNVEYFIFDDSKSYDLYKKYVATHKETEASNDDWKFLYDHFLATYLKSNTYRVNNYLQPVGNAYLKEGQPSIPEIQIQN